MSIKSLENHTGCPGEKLDPRVVRTRQLLQKALKELLGEGRFSEITVQDITERATVNRATFYAHFEDKYALLEDMLASDLRNALIARIQPGSPFDHSHVRTFAMAVIEFLGNIHSGCTHKREFGPLLDTTMQGTVQEFLTMWMSHAPDSDLKRGQSNEIVATVFSWAFYGAGMRWAREAKRPPLEAFTDDVMATLSLSPL